MDGNYKPYDFKASFARLDFYLRSAEANYEERDKLPDRDDLTFNNGFYAYCSALFIDIRESSKLPAKYNLPALAKVYRAFISEMVALLNSDPYVREVNIVGDCVWAVYNTPRRSDIDDVFRIAFQANSLMKALRLSMARHGLGTPIFAGIGMAYGRALMIKAGHNGSGINDVVYMGDVVNRAAHLAAQGSQGWRPALMVDETFGDNLNEHNTGLIKWDANLRCYTGDVVHKDMDAWLSDN